MDNTFLEEGFYWRSQNPPHIRFLNKLLGRFRVPLRVKLPLNPLRDMTTLEMRINLFHLVEQVCVAGVAGELAEFGVFTGETATIFGDVARTHAPEKVLHLYDNFATSFALREPIRPRLEANLAARNLTNFRIHEGYFEQTVPSELPERLAFVHVDCGFGGDAVAVAKHVEVLLHLFEHVYPRLAPGGILALMDYCDPERLRVELAVNPGVQLAADRFFAGRPEKVAVLLAGEAGLGYVRKL